MGLVNTFIKNRSEIKRLAFYLCGQNETAEDIAQDAFIRIYRAEQRKPDFIHEKQEMKYISAAVKSIHLDRVRDKYGSRNSDPLRAVEVEVSSEELYLFLVCQGGGREDEVTPDKSLDEAHEDITHQSRKELCLELLTLYHPHIKKTFEDRMAGKSFNQIVKESGRGLNTVLGEFRYATRFLKTQLDAIKQQTGGPLFEPVQI